MADKKISALVSLAGVDLSDADLIPVVDVSTAEAKAVSISGIKDAFAATFSSQAQTEIYTTEALGRAAVADGQAFKVQGSGNVAAYEYRRTNSTTSVLISTYPAYSAVSPIISAFTVNPNKNLYNKAEAVNGKIVQYSTGLNVDYANGISLGYFPVEAGKTYTVSMADPLGFHPSFPFFCRKSDGTYLGLAQAVGATPAMASPPTGIIWTGTSQVTFTIPGGSLIGFVGFMTNYSVHTTDDFNRVVGTVQAEIGSVKTAYSAYSPDGYAELSVLQSTIDYSIAAAAATVYYPISVTKAGETVYIRSSLNDTLDIIQQVVLTTGVAFTNDTVNGYGARSCLKTVLDAATAWASGSIFTSSADSSAPLQVNGTYIAANHGASIVREVNATAHGKTVQDVGSEWTDGGSIKWYLMRIVDANTLWFVSQNNSTYPAWSFSTEITGSTLTHSAGATHTASITVGSSVLTQLLPCLQNQTKLVRINGTTPITTDGIYRCNSVDIENAYDVANPAAVVSYVTSLVGGATQPSFIDVSIAADFRRTLTYKYAENGSCTIIDGIRNFNTISLGYYGAAQAEALYASGKQLWQYVPRTNPIVGTLKTWNLKAQEDISGTIEYLYFTSPTWEDADNPPDRMAQIVKTAGVAEFGLMIGYSPLRSTGVPALRKTLVTEAGFLSPAKKQYPKAVNGGTLPANSYFEIVAYRAYWIASANPDATCFTWYRDGKNVIVVADFHKNVSMSKLTLPSKFTGMDVEVIDKTASATLHGNGVVTPGGILVSVSGGYGYVVLKLS